MKAISKYLPKNHNELVIFCSIITFIFAYPMIFNFVETVFKLEQLNKEFFNGNPEMEEMVNRFEKCRIKQNNKEYLMDEKCIMEFRKSTTDEQNYKLANYYNKKKEILLQARENLN